jgi:hypothetical protein
MMVHVQQFACDALALSPFIRSIVNVDDNTVLPEATGPLWWTAALP